jgi:hypothetical protein
MKWLIRALKARNRAGRIAGKGRDAFAAAVYGCQLVSHYNTGIAFVVRHVGAFGCPEIRPIERPENVTISENDDYVVVRDGEIFELNKRK